MLYMVEFRYGVQQRDNALRYVMQHGSIGYAGSATLRSAWVATHDHIAYALVEAQDEKELEQACDPMRQFGEFSFHEVYNLEQL